MGRGWEKRKGVEQKSKEKEDFPGMTESQSSRILI